VTDHTFERVLRSLKENSARFESQQSTKEQRQLRRRLVFGLTFVSGIAVGIFVVLVRSLI
jgi:hypothetical protein